MQSLQEVLNEFRQAGNLPPAGSPAKPTAETLTARRVAAAQRTVAYFAALADDGRPPQLEPSSEILGLRDDGLPPCPTCRGMRKVRFDVPTTDASFGMIRDCPACLSRPDVAPRVAADRAFNAGLSREQVGQTFESFKAVPLSQAAYNAAVEWSVRAADWLVIHGEPGSGKSHLAAAAVNRLAGAGRQVRYWYSADLARAAKRQIGQGGNAEDEFVTGVKELPILVLDDLGAAQLTDYVLRVFEEIVDHRYRHRLATLITLISAPSVAKEDVSESICRRMEDPRICRIVHNQAPQWSDQ
jgi:chromosomal replication initiation ATPase DnaA